jgi:hypothetical protein
MKKLKMDKEGGNETTQQLSLTSGKLLLQESSGRSHT